MKGAPAGLLSKGCVPPADEQMHGVGNACDGKDVCVLPQLSCALRALPSRGAHPSCSAEP